MTARIAAAWAVVTLAGCPPADRSTQPDEPAAELPRAEVSLSIGVTGDDAMRRAVDRLRGEWNALTGGEYRVTLIDAEAIAGGHDLVVFPCRKLGELCEAKALRPVRPGVLRLDLLRFSDFEPAVRELEVVYGQRVMALPLGCPTPLWVAGAGSPSPSDDDGKASTKLALEFLARAAPHAVHPSRDATLFEPGSMIPRLGEPPFVRALQLLVESSSGADGEWPGRFVWPLRAEPALPDLAADRVGGPPMADEAYNPLAGAWEPIERTAAGATLIGSSGRLIGVTSASRNAATAFRLAAWLAGIDNAPVLMTASDGVAVCRGSFARSADAWRAEVDRATARAFAAANAEALRRSRRMVVPRLPGVDDYLDALGRRVREAIEGDSAGAALAAAVADWEAITDRLGRERQAAAYARSLNAAGFD